MPATTSWADRIKQAQEGEVKFAPLELGEHNFTVEEASVRVSKNSGKSYLNIKAKVLDGPQANARVFHSLFPESTASLPLNNFLAFYKAVGLNTEWLTQSNPSLDEIASAFMGRNFSAEVYVEEDAQMDTYTNAPRRSIRNPKEQGAAVPTATESSPVPSAPGTPDASGFGKPASPAPATTGFGNTAPTESTSPSPWNTPSASEPPF